MNQIKINIENLKCHGCAATIKKALHKFNEVKEVDIDIENSIVKISYAGENTVIDALKSKLANIGYPEKGNNNTISVAKSYVSCAIGRMS